MKWMLLIFIFDISNGGMKMLKQEQLVFNSRAACDAEGERLQKTVEYPGDDVRSISICIPQSAFND